MNMRTVVKAIIETGELTDELREYAAKKIMDYWENHPDVVNRFPRWKKYIAWVAGYQKFDYNKITKKLVEVPLNRKRSSMTFNRLKPFVRTLLAKMNQDVPQMSVVPSTDEDEDIEAARGGDRLIEGLADKMHFLEELSSCKLWIILCNRAYLRVFWDEDSNGIVGYQGAPKEQSQVPDPGQQIIDSVEGPEPTLAQGSPIEDEGDIRIQSIPPFNCRVDPLYQDRTKWRWFLFGEEVDAEDVEEQYDLKKGSIKEQSDTLDSAYDIEMQDEHDLIIGNPEKHEDITGRTAVHLEFWTPDVWIFMCGGKILDFGLNDHGEIPFFDMEDRLIPIDNYEKGFSYNESLIKDAIPIQRDYNRIVSLMSLAIERASMLKVLTPLGALLNKKQWTNDYGVFIDYNRNAGEPHQMKMDPFPMDVPAYRSSLEREMETAMNVHQASFGQLPERASHASGTLVNLLLEQDDIVINPLLNHINNRISDAWRLALKIVQANYTTERMIKYTGEDGMIAVQKFQGSDLRGNTDVKVVSQTGLPRSRALKVEYLMRLRSEGLLTDDKSTLELLEFGNANKIFKDELLHERRAMRENAMIEESQMKPDDAKSLMYPLEDHGVHIKIHLRLRLGNRIARLSPEQVAALDAHIDAHKSAIEAIQIEQAQLEAKMMNQGMAGQTTQEAPIPEGG